VRRSNVWVEIIPWNIPTHLARSRDALRATITGSGISCITHLARSRDALLLLKAERDENVCRKDFTTLEAVGMGGRLEEFEEREAKKRQKEHGGTAPGRPKDTSGKLPEVSTGRTRDKVAAAIGMSGKTYEKAKAVVASGDKEAIDLMDSTGKVGAKASSSTRAVRRRSMPDGVSPKVAEWLLRPSRNRRKSSRGDRIRTCDLLTPSQTR
jgi:hypothetical protein